MRAFIVCLAFFTVISCCLRAEDSPSGLQSTVVSRFTVKIPRGMFLLIRIADEHAAVKMIDPVRGGEGGVKYVWHYQSDGSGSFVNKNAKHGQGVVFERDGQAKNTDAGAALENSGQVLHIPCDRLALEWSSGNWIHIILPDAKLEFAVAGDEDIGDIDYRDKNIDWRRTNEPPPNIGNRIRPSDFQKYLRENRWDDIEKLIREDPRNPVLSKYERYTLYQAGLSGKIDVAKFYINRGSDVDKKLNNGWTLLHLSVRMGHTELAKYLIEEGADLYTKTDEDMTPMMFAVLHKRPEIEKLLLAKGVAKDAFTETIRGDTEAVKAYLGKEPGLVDEYRGHFSLLHWAVYRGHHNVASMLIERGADVQGHQEFAPPLFWAVRYNRVDLAKLLLANGAYVNSTNAEGQTPLFIAARTNVARFLLENGADPTIRDNSGDSPLHRIGTKYMHKEAVRTIIDFSGHPGFSQTKTVTEEAINEQLGVAKLLIAHGADPGQKNKEGKTAIDVAKEGGFQPIISYFEARHLVP